MQRERRGAIRVSCCYLPNFRIVCASYLDRALTETLACVALIKTSNEHEIDKSLIIVVAPVARNPATPFRTDPLAREKHFSFSLHLEGPCVALPILGKNDRS
jgi:hypothetical protein